MNHGKQRTLATIRGRLDDLPDANAVARATERLRRFTPNAPDDACWPFTGPRGLAGYGRIRLCGGRSRKEIYLPAHRFAYGIARNILRDLLLNPEIFVLHRCDNPPCCNPSHLMLGTPLFNMLDKAAKGRAFTPIGRSNPRAKLTPDQVTEIRRTVGRSPKEMAQQFGVSPVTVRHVLTGYSWSEGSR